MILAEIISHFWTEASKKCTNAVVFMDSVSAECLHWSGGVRLLDKAHLIREFSVFESAPSEYKKAVFFITSPILGHVEETLRNIIQASSLEYCVVISSCHPAVLSWSRHPGRDWNTEDNSSIHGLEEQLLLWMGNVNFTAEVLHLPLSFFSPLPCLLLAPSSSSLLAPIAPDLVRCADLWRTLHPGQSPSSEPGSWALMPLPLQTRIRQNVASINSLLTTLGAREEIFSLGSMARILGDQLESWAPARARRKTATNKVSLVIVDRTLDLASSCNSSYDTFLSRATDILERLPGHTTDIQVDMAKLFGTSSSPSALVCGSLASPGLRIEDKEREEEELNMLALGSEKELFGLLHKNLLSGSNRNKSSDSSVGKKFINAATLQADLKGYEGNYEDLLTNLSTVTRAQAVVSCLSQELNIRRKKVGTLCVQYAQLIGSGGGTGLLTEITDLIRSRRDVGLHLDDILRILLFVYSALDVRDKFDLEEEDRLRSVLGEAVLRENLEENGLGPILSKLAERNSAEEGIDEVVALGIVDSIWERLEGLRASRTGLGSFHSLISGDGVFCGLLDQLMGQIYSPDQGEVESLHHHSGGLGAMLRSGLGWLGSAPSKPHPRESPWVIIMVIGGVTAGEVAASRKFVTGTESKLTIASSRILSPRDALQLAFTHDCLS